MHSNDVSFRSPNVVFNRIGFVIQKELVSQFVVYLSFIRVLLSLYNNLKVVECWFKTTLHRQPIKTLRIVLFHSPTSECFR